MRAFINNYSLRPACFSCKVKNKSGSDITLGDYWGIEKQHSRANKASGVSCVIVHTQRGMDAMKWLDKDVVAGNSSLEKLMAKNASITRAVPMPDSYDMFFDAVRSKVPIDDLMREFPFHRSIFMRTLSHVNGLRNAIRIHFEPDWRN